MSQEKIRIRKRVKLFSEDILQDSLENILSNLKSLSDKLINEGWTNLELQRYYYCDSGEFELHGINIETDEEFENRKVEEKIAQLKIEQEKALYAKLKSKYGE